MALDKKQTVVLSSKIFGKDQRFKAVIQRVNPDTISLDLTSAPVEIPAGTPLTVWFLDESAIYSFESEAVTPKSSIVSLFSIKKPANIKKSFKRNFKRVRIKLQAVLKEISGPDGETVYITDLSAGGSKAVGKPGRSKGDATKITFLLPDGQIFDDIGCDIIRVTNLGTGLVEYGLAFRVLSKIRQQKLSDFIANAILTGQAEVIE
jgi:c-di-GMP-binding flagellar brake protein YcgR